MQRVHEACTSECTHRLVPDRGGVIMQRSIERDRESSEAFLAETFPGKRIEYLGISAEHEMHTWRVGAKPWRPLPSTERSEGKQAKREIKCEYRSRVWTGSGQPVGEVDFTRSAPEPEQAYPMPSVTSDMPATITPSQPASGLLTLAQAHGWEGVIKHACGHVPHATHGRPSAQPKASESVRLVRGAQRAVAVRMGGSWASLWTWSPDQFFTRHATLEAFRGALR